MLRVLLQWSLNLFLLSRIIIWILLHVASIYVQWKTTQKFDWPAAANSSDPIHQTLKLFTQEKYTGQLWWSDWKHNSAEDLLVPWARGQSISLNPVWRLNSSLLSLLSHSHFSTPDGGKLGCLTTVRTFTWSSPPGKSLSWQNRLFMSNSIVLKIWDLSIWSYYSGFIKNSKLLKYINSDSNLINASSTLH